MHRSRASEKERSEKLPRIKKKRSEFDGPLYPHEDSWVGWYSYNLHVTRKGSDPITSAWFLFLNFACVIMIGIFFFLCYVSLVAARHIPYEQLMDPKTYATTIKLQSMENQEKLDKYREQFKDDPYGSMGPYSGPQVAVSSYSKPPPPPPSKGHLEGEL